ncbi:MAG TPA: type II toxin-antitoxin system RelE/ParE family toxin [Terriglobia bacterium]
MPNYAVVFARSARRELERIPAKTCDRVLSAIERLGANPRPAGVRKLHGTEGVWRLRIGDYRVVYSVDDTQRVIDIQVVRHRKDVYR